MLVFGEAEGLPGELPGTVEVLDAELEPTLGDDELERARIEAGVPAWGKELDDSILPPRRGSTRRTSRSRRAATRARSRSRACTTAAR